MKTRISIILTLIAFRLSAQDFSNCIAYAEVMNPPYSSSGTLANYESDYSPVINMSPSIFSWSGSFFRPAKMRVTAVNSNKGLIIDFSDEKSLLQKSTRILRGREKLNQRKHNVICPTDLCIIDMNNNIVFKCNLYWTKTFRINLKALKSGYYILCYYDQAGYITRGIELN
jgi:hypothetical protein